MTPPIFLSGCRDQEWSHKLIVERDIERTSQGGGGSALGLNLANNE